MTGETKDSGQLHNCYFLEMKEDSMKQRAEKIIYGNIYTVDRKHPGAAAVAIADGKFAYVGDEAGVKEFI